ncbi:hypothetical protein C0995_002712 [Termitomyces sp. Mi166|nr:hypothetical protein C0995_002712 [Termitomyces sp. Mi166\
MEIKLAVTLGAWSAFLNTKLLKKCVVQPKSVNEQDALDDVLPIARAIRSKEGALS